MNLEGVIRKAEILSLGEAVAEQYSDMYSRLQKKKKELFRALNFRNRGDTLISVPLVLWHGIQVNMIVNEGEMKYLKYYPLLPTSSATDHEMQEYKGGELVFLSRQFIFV